MFSVIHFQYSVSIKKFPYFFSNGILKVSAVDKLTGRETKIDFQTGMGRLSKIEVERMVRKIMDIRNFEVGSTSVCSK